MMHTVHIRGIRREEDLAGGCGDGSGNRHGPAHKHLDGGGREVKATGGFDVVEDDLETVVARGGKIGRADAGDDRRHAVDVEEEWVRRRSIPRRVHGEDADSIAAL